MCWPNTALLGSLSNTRVADVISENIMPNGHGTWASDEVFQSENLFQGGVGGVSSNFS